jgi:hypothetical protein
MPRSLQESKLANLDMNLLVSLDALLQERSVSRAAERLGLSQPSLSASLARLRRHFRDDLLARVGNRYELTPLAAQLAEQTTSALAAVARVFASEPDFDPATSEREFTVLISDYAITGAGPAAGRAPAASTALSGSGCTSSPCPRSTMPPRRCATSTRWCCHTGSCRTCRHGSYSPTSGSASSPPTIPPSARS